MRHDLEHLFFLRAELAALGERAPASGQVVFDLFADGVEEAADRHGGDLAVQVAERGEDRVFADQVGGQGCDAGFGFSLVL